MANLSEIFLKQETLETLLTTVKAKGLKGVSLTISMNDEANDYGQNVQSYVSQTKEDREAKKPKFWTGSGKVFWSDGKPAMVVEKSKHINLKQNMRRRKATPSHSKFILKRRFMNKFNEYTEWQDIGHGEFLSIEDVQDKIKVLIQNYKTKHMEVHFEMNGKLLDFNGNEISHPIKFTPK